MKNILKSYIADNSGATAIEYGLIAALIAISLIFAFTNIGQAIANHFTTVETAL